MQLQHATESLSGGEVLYRTRNSLCNKRAGLLRISAASFVFGFAFMLLLTGFVTFTASPQTRIHLHAFATRSLSRTLLASALVGILIAGVTFIALLVQLRTFEVLRDRLRITLGRFTSELPFSEITDSSIIAVATWPGPRHCLHDFMHQFHLCCAGYKRVGLAQWGMARHADLVLLKRGKKRGYLIDVDEPREFLDALNTALQRWRDTGA